MAGRQRSAARGVKAGLTRLRRRRWSSPLMWRMLRRISSSSGPSSTPNISAIRSPGKVALFVRRKKEPASRSSTKYPSSDFASQVSRRNPLIVS
jgi:hypothetical protein